LTTLTSCISEDYCVIGSYKLPSLTHETGLFCGVRINFTNTFRL